MGTMPHRRKSEQSQCWYEVMMKCIAKRKVTPSVSVTASMGGTKDSETTPDRQPATTAGFYLNTETIARCMAISGCLFMKRAYVGVCRHQAGDAPLLIDWLHDDVFDAPFITGPGLYESNQIIVWS